MTDFAQPDDFGHSNSASLGITAALFDTFEEISRKSRETPFIAEQPESAGVLGGQRD